MLAASIYSVALSFIVQEYVSSPAVNSLVNNISVAVSVAFALAIGSFVDQHGAWRILFHHLAFWNSLPASAADF